MAAPGRSGNISIHSLRMEGDPVTGTTAPYTSEFQSTPSAWRETGSRCFFILNPSYFNPLPPHGGRLVGNACFLCCIPFQSTPSAWRETSLGGCARSIRKYFNPLPPHGGRREDKLRLLWICCISIHSLRMEGDSKTAQESVFHFAYPCTILQKRMQKTTFCTRKNGFFRKKGEKFGAKPSASFCAPMIRTDTFPLNFSHRISGSSMSMVSFAPICSTFD